MRTRPTLRFPSRHAALRRKLVPRYVPQPALPRPSARPCCATLLESTSWLAAASCLLASTEAASVYCGPASMALIQSPSDREKKLRMGAPVCVATGPPWLPPAASAAAGDVPPPPQPCGCAAGPGGKLAAAAAHTAKGGGAACGAAKCAKAAPPVARGAVRSPPARDNALTAHGGATLGRCGATAEPSAGAGAGCAACAAVAGPVGGAACATDAG